jgi:hypothetical protein
VKEFMDFTKLEDRLIDAGFIAINITILTIWVSTGVSDTASYISFYALVVSLPMLAIDLLLSNMPHIQYGNKWYRYSARFIRSTGWRFALFGVDAAIWHVSWYAALVFGVVGVFCIAVYFQVWNETKSWLDKEEKKLTEQKSQ